MNQLNHVTLKLCASQIGNRISAKVRGNVKMRFPFMLKATTLPQITEREDESIQISTRPHLVLPPYQCGALTSKKTSWDLFFPTILFFGGNSINTTGKFNGFFWILKKLHPPQKPKKNPTTIFCGFRLEDGGHCLRKNGLRLIR